MNSFYVYILASRRHGTLYIGVTNNLLRRISEHKSGQIEGFTKRYKVDRLVYYEETSEPYGAITREKQMKKWRRVWEIELIEKNNPQWRDLYDDIIEA